MGWKVVGRSAHHSVKWFLGLGRVVKSPGAADVGSSRTFAPCFTSQMVLGEGLVLTSCLICSFG